MKIAEAEIVELEETKISGGKRTIQEDSKCLV